MLVYHAVRSVHRAMVPALQRQAAAFGSARRANEPPTLVVSVGVDGVGARRDAARRNLGTRRKRRPLHADGTRRPVEAQRVVAVDFKNILRRAVGHVLAYTVETVYATRRCVDAHRRRQARRRHRRRRGRRRRCLGCRSVNGRLCQFVAVAASDCFGEIVSQVPRRHGCREHSFVLLTNGDSQVRPRDANGRVAHRRPGTD